MSNAMKRCTNLLAAALCLATGLPPVLAQPTPPTVHFAIAVHSEQPGGDPPTPDFRTVPSITYHQWREAVLWFADACQSRGLAWNFQSDWNFLEGVVRFETPSGADYTPELLTNNLNTIQHLHNDLGVELDPHSHENGGYNFADVAYLIDVACDSETSFVVGGHVYDPAAGVAYQNWPKFIADADGLNGNRHPYSWRPHLLMGAAAVSHQGDPHVAGLWRPQGTNSFFVDDPAGSIAAIGNWAEDLHETDRLLRLLEDGALPHNNRLWTCGLVFNHRDMLSEEGRNTILAQLQTIKRWRDAGRFTVATFEAIYQTWTNAPFHAQSSVHVRPDDNLSFSLNWQDFSYPADSFAELRALLNMHESCRVPVDVFLTTWQTDLLEAHAPELLGRLQSSLWVSMGYHVRAPKPYANEYAWTNSTAESVAQYESCGLNLTNGLPTASSGGFAKLTTLLGYPPTVVGANADASLASLVHAYFAGAGAGLLVEHRNTAVNLGENRNGLDLRPEHYDWRLIEVFRGDTAIDTLDEALAAAQGSTNGAAPWFVGVKLHDNDLFAEQSAWTFVYQSPSRIRAHWMDRPWDTNSAAAPLAAELRDQRRAFYTNLVTEAANRRTAVNLVDSRDTLSLLGTPRPRVPGLSATEVMETPATGVEVAQLTGGGVVSGVAVDYELVAGEGATDNALFAINGDRLIAISPLDHETKPVCRLRIRWTDGGGFSGERPLTLVVANSVSDDDDADGYTEAQEQSSGTDPLDPASALRVSLSSVSPAQVVLNITSVPGRTYQIERSNDLLNWIVEGTPMTAIQSSLTGTLTNTNAGCEFYRVRVTGTVPSNGLATIFR